MSDKKKKIILISGISVAIIIVGALLLLLFGNDRVQYNVLFNSNGGSSVEAITVDENGYIKKPTDPTRENYMFAGWYYNDELFDFSKPITGDITLEARWLELVDASGIELDQTKLTLGVGKKAKLIVTIKPENARDKSVVWSSSNTEVVSVDKDCNVTAKKAGTATITVTTKDGKYKAEAEVTVQADVVNVKGVSLDKTSLNLKVNETSTLKATVKPGDATNKGVTWSSSDSNVASVDNNGKVTAKAAGTATITVTTADGSKTATCTVTVSERPANYVVKFTPYRQEGTGAVLQYTIAVTKNGETFTNYSKIIYDGKPTGSYLAADRYNENISEATIILSENSSVTARVEY